MGSPYTLPVPSANPYGIYGSPYGPYGANSSGSQQSSVGWNVSSPYVDVDPNASMEDIFSTNRNVINTNGNVIGNEAGNALNYYDPLQQQYQGAAANALNNLQSTPGYNAGESSQIGADYGQFNTSPQALQSQFLNQGEQTGIAGNPAGSTDVAGQGVANEGAFLNQYQSNLGGQLGQYATNLGQGGKDFASGVGGAASNATQNVNSALAGANSGVGSALTGANSGVTGALGSYGSGLQSALGSEQGGVNSAVSGLGSGLQDAQGKFSNLDSAVYDPSLGFDPNQTEKQLTDQDVQEMRTAAGVSAGDQFQTAEDTLERQAAQAGNTSPAALAAMRQNLVTQEAATAGDVENQAEINAKQAQYSRAAGIEGQRLGATQTQAGMKATAATTEEAAAQAAAGLTGQSNLAAQQFLGSQGVGAANSLGQANLQGQQYLGGLNLGGQQYLGTNNLQGQQYLGTANLGAQNAIGQNEMQSINNLGSQNINSANQYGQFSTGQGNTMTNQMYNAASTAEQLASQRAALIAQNRQATQTGVNNTAYSQGTGSQQLNSQGQQAIGGARIAGNNSYLSGAQTQQGMAQQGAQAAQQTQLGAYGTQTSGLNANSTGQAGFEVGKPSLGDSLGQAAAGLIGTAGGAAAKAGAAHLAAGDIVTEPTTAIIGEDGPEIVVPAGKEKLLQNPNSRYKAQHSGGALLPAPDAPEMPSASGGPSLDPLYSAPDASQDPSDPGLGIQSRWTGTQMPSYGKGKLVTHPVVARLGESGPEAVIPLTPRVGNKLQPDLLEGHGAAPKVPGVSYSRYKGFSNRAFLHP